MAHTSLRSHRKLSRLVRLLKLPRPHVVGLLECMWWAVYETKSVGRDGALVGWTADDIASAAEFDGDAKNFVSALVEAGFLDDADGTICVHDYFSNAPDYVRKRIERAQKTGSVQTSADNGGQCLPTQRNPTEGNVTQLRATQGPPQADAEPAGGPAAHPGNADLAERASRFAQNICEALRASLAENQAQVCALYFGFAEHPHRHLIALSLIDAAKGKASVKDADQRLRMFFKVANDTVKRFADPTVSALSLIPPRPREPSPDDCGSGRERYERDMANWTRRYGDFTNLIDNPVLEGVGA